MMWVPPGAASSAGREAVDLAAAAGLYLDPWQEFVLDQSLGERPDGAWNAFEVGLHVPRQNGKGGILEARELAGLFLFGERLIIHSAHLFETSMEHFLRIKNLIEGCPDLERRVFKVSHAHGEQGITLKRKYGGNRLKFKTRTPGGGRGLSGDLVVLDEAMEIPEATLSALMPTMSARPNPQLWYTGSAVDQLIHAHGLVFAKIRARGMAGGDPSLAWFDWSVDPDVYNRSPETVAADPRQWAVANPGQGIRITREYIGNEHRSMGSRGFATERLGIGDWPDPSDGADQKIPAGVWDVLEDPHSKPEGPVAFSFDVTPERDYAAIGAAGSRHDGKKHLEVLIHDVGTRWVVPELVKLTRINRPCVIMVDGRSPAASLIPELEEAGIRVSAGDQEPAGDEIVKVVSLQGLAAACGALYDAAMSDGLRHLGQAWLDGALKSAKERDVGDGAWAWARKSGGNIAPLVAVTLAAHGHARYANTRQPDILSQIL